MRTLPGLTIISPADKYEVKGAVSEIINNQQPYYLRLGRNGEEPIHKNCPPIKESKFIQIAEGKSGVILFTGSIGLLALAARDELLKRSIHVGIYSVPYVNRIDPNELAKICAHGKILVLEEHFYKGGLGSEILETMNEFNISASVRIIASKRTDISAVGSRDYLLNHNGISVEKIMNFFTPDLKI